MDGNKKILLSMVFIVLVFIAFWAFNDLILNKKPKKIVYKENEIVSNQVAEKIEIFMFHTTQRCASCVNIGRYTKELLERYFSEELMSEKIIFKEINIDLPENKEISQKFKAAGSSLFVNVIYNNQDHINEDASIWRLAYDQEGFETYFKNKIDNFLQK